MNPKSLVKELVKHLEPVQASQVLDYIFYDGEDAPDYSQIACNFGLDETASVKQVLMAVSLAIICPDED